MMSDSKRTTIYFDHHLYRALRLKAAEIDRSVSDLVNEAVRLQLAEDAGDLAAFDDRADEPNLKFEEVLKDLKRMSCSSSPPPYENSKLSDPRKTVNASPAE